MDIYMDIYTTYNTTAFMYLLHSDTLFILQFLKEILVPIKHILIKRRLITDGVSP